MMTAATISKLRQLLRGEMLPYSALSNSLREELISEHLLIVQVHGSRRKLYAYQPNALQIYLSQHYEELRTLHANSQDFDYRTRAEQAADSGNSKLVQLRSCPGFLVNAYEPIDGILCGQHISVYPADGSMLFIADWQSFSIPSDVVIVGVENMENFRKIREQKYLFKHLGAKVLFVSRYPQSKDLRLWLMHISNKYIHFGDFDIAGLHIFETEFKKFLGDQASFFIPNDIEMRLIHGSIKRYNDQIIRFKNYIPADQQIQPLYQLINHYHRTYDQEGYIEMQNYKN